MRATVVSSWGKTPVLTESLVEVRMSKAHARRLREQMAAFWRSLNGQEPAGDSPFAKLCSELERVVGEKA